MNPLDELGFSSPPASASPLPNLGSSGSPRAALRQQSGAAEEDALVAQSNLASRLGRLEEAVRIRREGVARAHPSPPRKAGAATPTKARNDDELRSELRALRNLVDLLPHTPQKKFPARLKRALSVSTALRAMGHDGESLRELLGEQDLASKTFLKNLTRFHRLKRRLDHIAATILSASFRENPEFCSRKPPQPPLQPSESLDALLACGAAAFPELKAMIGDAVRAADLKPLDQPNMFIEIAQGGDELYTAGTPGPLKTRERCAEKAKNEYDDDFRRLVDVARASIVVDTEDQLEAVFRHLLADPARVVRLKNRFANPSFNGYRDALFTVRLDLPGGGSHLAEIQVHLSPILALKAEAHVYYNFFRTHFHGNMKSCDVCMKLLDGVVGQEEFSVAMLEKVAKSRDVTKLAMLGRLFEVHCQQYAIAKLFLMRCAQVEGERGGAGYA